MARKVRANTVVKTGKPWASAGSYPTVLGPIVTGGASVAAPSAPTAAAGVLTGTYSRIFVDDFTGTDLNYAVWDDHEWYQGAPGYSFDAWYPVPAINKTIFMRDSILTFQARRDATVPTALKWRTGQIDTRDRWFSPAGDVDLWFEARLFCPAGFGVSPQWWAEGDDRYGANSPWPGEGELDFMEMFNITEATPGNAGYLGIPFQSVHYRNDAGNHEHVGRGYLDKSIPAPYTNPDGSLKLTGSWHTFSCHRTKDFMRQYIDGVYTGNEFKPGVSYDGSEPLPSMLFTNKVFLRLGLGVGGYQGSGKPESQWQESDFQVDYVAVYQKTA